jgi:hypothetical protein
MPQYDIANPSVSDKRRYGAPLPFDFIFTKADESSDYFAVKQLQDEFGFEFPVVVGCLLWLLNTFSRLQFAVRKLAKFMRLPGRNHFRAMKHLLHHLRCYHLNGITFYSETLESPIARLLFEQGIESPSPCFTFADSSWQDCPDTGRSTAGFHVFVQGGVVESASHLPDPVALSSAESEYNNCCVATMATNAIAMLVQELRGNDPDDPMCFPIILDSMSCIAMGNSFRDTKHTRHILRRYHFTRYMVSSERAMLCWVSGDVQISDPTTKNTSASAPTYILQIAMIETKVDL